MTGFFGKLPTSGDFVARALAPGVRPLVDRWLTRMLAPYSTDLRSWPEAGLRGAIEGPAGMIVLVAVPSEDQTGRSFPLAALAQTETVNHMAVDTWADAVLPFLDEAVVGTMSAAELQSALAGVAPPQGQCDLAPPVLWHAGCAPGQPVDVLAARFVAQT